LFGWKRRRSWPLLMALAAVGLSMCTGCVQSLPVSSGQATVATVTITATADSQQPTSTTLTLTMQ
jgi:ABC-type glycerol-3-phosphate transport system substrate-binding protein